MSRTKSVVNLLPFMLCCFIVQLPSGMILCQGSDGHVGLELAAAKHCRIEDNLPAHEHEHVSTGAPAISADCHDIPLHAGYLPIGKAGSRTLLKCLPDLACRTTRLSVIRARTSVAYRPPDGPLPTLPAHARSVVLRL